MSQQKKEKSKIADHRHCVVCGRAISPDEQVCSPDCREKLELSKEKEKKSRRMMLIIYVVMIIMLILFFLFRPAS
ncbi:MAG: DUF2116 family Zn-ribbon domain-containing protein [Nitrososphaerota archaeon]